MFYSFTSMGSTCQKSATARPLGFSSATGPKKQLPVCKRKSNSSSPPILGYSLLVWWDRPDEAVLDSNSHRVNSAIGTRVRRDDILLTVSSSAFTAGRCTHVQDPGLTPTKHRYKCTGTKAYPHTCDLLHHGRSAHAFVKLGALSKRKCRNLHTVLSLSWGRASTRTCARICQHAEVHRNLLCRGSAIWDQWRLPHTVWL